jgi:hypothetical protein
MITRRLVPGLALVPLLLAVPGSTAAQNPGATASSLNDSYQTDVAEQEGAVFGRLRYIEGDITLRRDDEITSDLVLNDPVTPGDMLTTGESGRVEIQLADGSIVRLDGGSELVLQSLADSSSQIENTTILQLGSGSLIVRANDMDSNEKRFQIDTDTASVFLLSDGQFRIDIRPDGTTAVSSRRGAAEVMAQEVSSIVRSGERTMVKPGRIPGDPAVFNTRLLDDFDGWSAQRDDAMVRRARVNEEDPAGLPEPIEPYANELSYYGHWQNNPSYGWIWRPVGLASDWQPYLYGRWVSSPTGLIWVSHEPWGWAPFHYGRWEFLVGAGWVWIPGYVFSGAHVAWGIAPGGYLGWCARGYYDYPVSFGYGIYHDPWVFVSVNNIFVRRVNTVIIRDVNVIKEIEKRRVVVAGRPKLDPRRLKDSPRVIEELYNRAKERPELRLGQQGPGARRMPFREHERQSLVAMNERRIKGEQKDAAPVSHGRTGRPVTVRPTERRVTVPPARRAPQGRPPAEAGRSESPRGKEKENPQPGAAGRGRTAGTPPNTPSSRPQASGGNPRLHHDTAPERVIPRILPRPRPEAGPGQRPPEAAPRAPRQSPPTRSTQPPKSQPSSGGGKEKKGNDKGGDRKGKG